MLDRSTKDKQRLLCVPAAPLAALGLHAGRSWLWVAGSAVWLSSVWQPESGLPGLILGQGVDRGTREALLAESLLSKGPLMEGFVILPLRGSRTHSSMFLLM